MSWSYSRALVAEFSEANCLDTEQSAQLNTTHMPDQFYSHGKTTEHSRLSRFGMTCEHLTESLGEELLTWFRAGFHAKTFLSQEKALESTANDQDSGEKWLGWLAKFDPDSCLWKTAQLSLLGDSGKCSVIFPRSGMTRGGLLWELPMLERPTSEIGYGCFPNGETFFHTPNTRGLDGGSNSRKALEKRQWPTPTVCGNYNRKGASKTSGDGLATAVRTWPTPTAHNAKETNAPSESARNTPTLAAQAGGPLNPDWVEWLMGWPIGHTDLKPSETVKSRNAEQPHGDILEAHE